MVRGFQGSRVPVSERQGPFSRHPGLLLSGIQLSRLPWGAARWIEQETLVCWSVISESAACQAEKAWIQMKI